MIRLVVIAAIAAALASTTCAVGCRKQSGAPRASEQMKSGGINTSGGQAPKAEGKVGKGDPTAVAEPGTMPEEAMKKMGKR